ncbi:MAG: hypothetical protein JXN64_14160 [Spirochaetes bacterium]|nr:hypothetical protein [Spirochaetota bacterium]
MNIKLFKYFIIILLFLIQCKSVDKSDYKNTNILKGNAVREIESGHKIDNWKTYELFFTLNDSEECIKVNLSSAKFDEVLNEDTAIKTFFIVEKAIDISKFGMDKKSLFSEIGRNYDYNWSAMQEITICSSAADPIKTLDKNNNFRIRFTVFKDFNFKYTLNIFSDHPVKITDKNPVIK